jgi:glycosyltransferase involved in cell wall biosynthesis
VKVLLVGTGAHPIPPTGYGGVERVLGEYSQALARAGHSVRVLNEVHGSGSLAEYRFAMGLPARVRREECDIVHVSTPVVANRLAAAGIPYVYTSHSRHWFWRESWRHRWGFWLERRSVRRAAAVVALTPEVESAIRAVLPSNFHAPVRVIPYGIDASEYAPVWDARTGLRALGVGIVLPLKRWEVAAASLKGTGVTLRIAGPTPDPAYAAKVRSAGDSVEILGEVDEPRLRQLYAESDLLVHPSRVEVLSAAVLQAMASGLPVVASSAVGLFVSQGKAGFVAPASASADELIRFFRTSVERLAGDAALRREMGESGRSLVLEKFSWDKVVAEHVALYNEVLRTAH